MSPELKGDRLHLASIANTKGAPPSQRGKPSSKEIGSEEKLFDPSLSKIYEKALAHDPFIQSYMPKCSFHDGREKNSEPAYQKREEQHVGSLFRLLLFGLRLRSSATIIMQLCRRST